MKRLTTNEPNNNFDTALNLFYIKDRMTWVRGGGPAPDYPDVTLPAYMREIIRTHGIDIQDEGDEDLDWIMTEQLFDGTDTLEGVLATFYTTAWAYSTLRERLAEYEDTGMTPEEAKSMRETWDMYGGSYGITEALAKCLKWIPVTERLPEINKAVLAYILWDDGERMVCFGCRLKTRWFLWHSDLGELLKDYTVTHWMPLPEPPEPLKEVKQS